jgi:malonyl-CoA/methylmalonyl-CoA synthetase
VSPTSHPVDTLAALLPAGGRPAAAPVLLGRAPLTYGELDEWASRVASVLVDLGLRPGDRVAYQVAKSPTVLALHLALLRFAAVQLPLNPAYTDAEVAALLADAEPSIVVRDPGRARLPGPWADLTLAADGSGTLRDAVAEVAATTGWPTVRADDGAALLYTSGTTGRPKGALLSHGNLTQNARTLVAAWGFTSDDVLLHVLPLFHTHGLFVATHCVLASGASMHLLERFDAARVVELLPDSSVMMGVPTHYARLVDQPGLAAAARRVRLFVSGSAPMPVALHERFTGATGQVVLERYGMTETSMLTSNPLHGERRAGTVGPPLPGVSVRVVDDADRAVATGEVGHVQVSGANVFHGYWRRPDLRRTEFTDDGWFRTGDLGRLDDDGYLELVGRAKDLVITGGLNVHPKEVEAVLEALPGVAEAAVVGLPDDDLGEAVTAVVVPTVGSTLDPETLRSSTRERLAGFKVPKRVVVVAELPRNAMGKVEKAKLRTQLAREP